MNQLAALYFPETDLERQTVCQLLLFFERLYYYNPAEMPLPSGFETFTENDLLVGYPPLPFGNDLPRFQRMLRDLKGSGSEIYRSGLFSMPTDQARLRDQDEASARSLKSSMTSTAEAKRELAQKETVWRAALFLELSKVLAQEEQEIAAGLGNIAIRQSQMLEAMRGDEEMPQEESLPRVKPLAPTPSPVGVEQLARAWGQLYLRDSAAERKQILATSRQEAAEVLLDIYETLTRKEPITLGRLPLPVSGGLDGEDYLGQREALRQAVAEHMPKIAAAFGQISHLAADAGSEETLASLQQELGKWADMLSDRVAGRTAGKSTLTIYLLEGLSWPQLFAKLCQPAAHDLATPPEAEPRAGVLAVLTPAADR